MLWQLYQRHVELVVGDVAVFLDGRALLSVALQEEPVYLDGVVSDFPSIVLAREYVMVVYLPNLLDSAKRRFFV
ncbi:hypothetical protein [Fischerella sp. PCC 9605]|uniref:hypothetical protein n=1 Tax=Fischerella sp. PCC 9605 TaxID=1173024 RepID=UPI00047A2C3D|nr:hypothetical protein [Fischerella sp. PCC 9605]